MEKNEKQVLEVLHDYQGKHLSITKITEILGWAEITVARILERLADPYGFAKCILNADLNDEFVRSIIGSIVRNQGNNIFYTITKKGIEYIEKEK